MINEGGADISSYFVSEKSTHDAYDCTFIRLKVGHSACYDQHRSMANPTIAMADVSGV